MGVGKKLLTFTIAIIGVAFIIGVSGADAAMMNWTRTTFTVDGADLDFESESSKYELSFSEPELQIDPIIIGGGQDEPTIVVGVLYEFLIPNFYDPLPTKIVDVKLRGGNEDAEGLRLARVLDVWGADAPYEEDGPALPVKGELTGGDLGAQLVIEEFQMKPNPDFEYVKVWAPTDFELESIEIVTQSVPLPASVLLFGPAVFGLVFLRRKLRK